MASFFQGVKNFIFGKGKEEGEEGQQQQQQGPSQHREAGHKRSRHSKGSAYQPVLQDAGHLANGGVQGLGWYTATLQQDADGDAAHAFYQEKQQQSTSSDNSSHLEQVDGKQAGRHYCKLLGVQEGRVVISGVS